MNFRTSDQVRGATHYQRAAHLPLKTMFHVMSNNTSWSDWEACVVSSHPNEEAAKAACPKTPGYWVEEAPENITGIYMDGEYTYH